MTPVFDDFQKLTKGNMDLAMRSFGTFSRSYQSIAADTADYTKKSFEDGAAAMEKIMSAKSPDKAMEIQMEYARKAYEDFVTQATKVGEYYAELTRDAYKPFEAAAARGK